MTPVFRYQVRQGETPTTIATKHSITPAQLLQANPGGAPFTTGQGINVPFTGGRYGAGTFPVPTTQLAPAVIGNTRVNSLRSSAQAAALSAPKPPVIPKNDSQDIVNRPVQKNDSQDIFNRFDVQGTLAGTGQSGLPSDVYAHNTQASADWLKAASEGIATDFQKYSDLYNYTGKVNSSLLPRSVTLDVVKNLSQNGFFNDKAPSVVLQSYGYTFSDGIWSLPNYGKGNNSGTAIRNKKGTLVNGGKRGGDNGTVVPSVIQVNATSTGGNFSGGVG